MTEKRICSKCGSTNIERADLLVYTSNPPCYKYRCKDCGEVFWLHTCSIEDYLDDLPKIKLTPAVENNSDVEIGK